MPQNIRLFLSAIFLVILLFLFFISKKIGKTITRIRFSKIDKMSGKEFENYLSYVYSSLGYKVKQIGGVGDFGADLIVEKKGVKTAIQAKRYNYKVDQKAIQQVFAAWYFYDCQGGVVVTNSYFTRAAKKLANKINVKLIDRDGLERMVKRKNSKK